MRTGLHFFILFCFAALHCSISFAGDHLRAGIGEATQKIVSVMQQQGFKSATILSINDETTLDSPGLSGIAEMLRASLTSQHVEVLEKQGDLGIAVSLNAPKEGEFGDRFLRLQIKLRNRFGDEIPELEGDFLVPQLEGSNFVDDDTVLGPDGKLQQNITNFDNGSFSHDLKKPDASLISWGLNGKLPPRAELNTPIEHLMQNPTTVIVGGNSAKMERSSPLTVRIVGENGPKSLRMVDGVPFVDFDAEEKFSIEVSNSGRNIVAATICVDGLNTFYFSETPQEHGTSWMIPGTKNESRAARLLLEGWYKQKGIAEKFIATTYERSKRKEAGMSKTPTGGLTILFHEAIKKADYVALPPKNPKLVDTDGVGVPKVGGGYAIVSLKNGSVESISDVTETITKTVQVPYTVTVRTEVYIGGAEEVEQQEGAPSEYVPDDAAVIGAITIRYRHPSIK